MKLRIGRLILGGSLLLLSGCRTSPTPPSEADAAAVWNNTLKQLGLADSEQLVDLKKTNGQMSEVNGTKVYTLFYQANVRYLKTIGKFQAGQVYGKTANYGFQLTEKGWQGPDGKVYAH